MKCCSITCRFHTTDLSIIGCYPFQVKGDLIAMGAPHKGEVLYLCKAVLLEHPFQVRGYLIAMGTPHKREAPHIEAAAAAVL